MIIVANMRDSVPGVVIPIYRGKSALGNPFVMKHEHRRDEVCDKYKDWLDRKIAEKDSAVCHELNMIYRLARDGCDVYLMCWCAPKRCHGDYIKSLIEEKLLRR